MSKAVQLTHVKIFQILTFESQIEAALFLGYKTKFVITKALKDQSLSKQTWKVQLRDK